MNSNSPAIPYCSTCRKTKELSQFGYKLNGTAYKTCLSCHEMDANCRQTRNNISNWAEDGLNHTNNQAIAIGHNIQQGRGRDISDILMVREIQLSGNGDV